MRSPAESGWSETRYACSWLEERLRIAWDLAAEVARTPQRRAVHDVRVACRRLREAIAFFRDTPGVPALPDVDRCARRLARSVGGVRELDVAQDRLGALELSEPLARDRLVRRLQKRRAELALRKGGRIGKRAEQLQRAIAARLPLSPSLKANAAGAVGETELRITLVGRLDERERQVEQRWAAMAGLLPRQVQSEQLHEARIAIKHWRYASEIARAVMPRDEYQTLSSKLRNLQAAGGKSQDWADLAEMLHDHMVGRKLDEEQHALQKAVNAELAGAARAFVAVLTRELRSRPSWDGRACSDDAAVGRDAGVRATTGRDDGP